MGERGTPRLTAAPDRRSGYRDSPPSWICPCWDRGQPPEVAQPRYRKARHCAVPSRAHPSPGHDQVNHRGQRDRPPGMDEVTPAWADSSCPSNPVPLLSGNTNPTRRWSGAAKRSTRYRAWPSRSASFAACSARPAGAAPSVGVQVGDQVGHLRAGEFRPRQITALHFGKHLRPVMPQRRGQHGG